MSASERRLLDKMHAACLSRNALRFNYTRLDGTRTNGRTVRPLTLYCWSGTWTLTAWCEMRNDFRTFRIDHIDAFEVLDRTFEQRRGQRLGDYLRRVQAELAAKRRDGAELFNSPFRA